MLYNIYEIEQPELKSGICFLSLTLANYALELSLIFQENKQTNKIYINQSFTFKNHLIKNQERRKNGKITSSLSSWNSNKIEIQWMTFSQESQ